MRKEDRELTSRLEDLGEDEVRRRFALGAFGDRKRNAVELWLAKRESDRRKQTEAENRKDRSAELSTAKSTERAAWAGVIVSVLSIALAAIALWFSTSARLASEVERVSFSATPDTAALYADVEPANPGGFIDTEWRCLISNLGSRSAAIVNVEVDPVFSRSDTSWAYNAVRNGFQDEQGRIVRLPINLEPGTSRILRLQLRFRIDSATESRLALKYRSRRIPMNVRWVGQLVSTDSADTARTFVNSFETTEFDPALHIREPRFLITLFTNHGATISRFTTRQ